MAVLQSVPQKRLPFEAAFFVLNPAVADDYGSLKQIDLTACGKLVE